jgi:hypothetical protein
MGSEQSAEVHPQPQKTHVPIGQELVDSIREQQLDEIKKVKIEVSQSHETSKPTDYSKVLDSLFEKLIKMSNDWNVNTLKSKVESLNKSYFEVVNFDVTKAKYYDEYVKKWDMNREEIEHLKNNGFVVSQRLGSLSFGEGYLAIYNSELPVIVTADSLLHCWHYSYDKILEQIEQKYLSEQLKKLLLKLLSNLLPIQRMENNEIFKTAYSDTEYFLLVAHYLLTASKTTVKEVRYWSSKPVEEPKPILSNDAQINSRLHETINAIESQQIQSFNLFGKPRLMDFSQFKPRGHYEKSQVLQRYFKCMMWLGRVDLRIAGGEENDSSLTELACALFLYKLISTNSEDFDTWKTFDSILQGFIGKTDSLTFNDINELQKIIKDEKMITNLDMVFSRDALQSLQNEILETDLGKQCILSHIYVTTPGASKRQIPRSWTFMGQRFAIDSWALSKLVNDQIPSRYIPSCIDIGYTVFGNNQASEIITNRISKPEVQQRDMDISKEIETVQKTIDCIPQDVWDTNLYTLWLKAIRTLSNASTSPDASKYPQVMRTKLWAHHDLNTQFASWAQLRHDTILYVKQSYGAMTLCDYPHGFVDPRVEFWDVLIQMGEKMKEISQLTRVGKEWTTLWIETITKLKTLAQKQLQQTPFTDDEALWIKRTIAKWYQGGSGAGWRRDGWYCNLFFGEDTASEEDAALIADVHTAPPSLGFQGTVLSEAVGNVNMLIAALDNGNDTRIYAGPVFSHYELIPNGINRYSDSEWKEMLKKKDPLIVIPKWTQEYTVKGTLPSKDSRLPTKATHYRDDF